jgi:uncharacterized protein YjiS (DUF1127 family)
MPADNHGSMTAIMRLLGKFAAWRQRRAARRAHLHGFMAMSDRALADIGVRRAHVYGALVGAMPLGRDAATPEVARPDAAIHEFHKRPRRPTLTVVANDRAAA